MKKLLLSIALFILITLPANAQTGNQEINQLTYYGYVHNSKIHFEKALELANQKFNKNDQWKSESKENQFTLAFAYYGVLNSTMDSQDEETFNQHIDQTMEVLEYIIEKNPEWGEPYAILSSVHGLRMAYSPWKGMYLGPKSSSLMTKALKYQPESPLVLKLYGISKLFTPEMFGGDTKEAIESLNKAMVKFEQTPTELSTNWLYLDALAFLGQAHSKNNDHPEAIKIYEKALDVEPEFVWVKRALLPSAIKNAK